MNWKILAVLLIYGVSAWSQVYSDPQIQSIKSTIIRSIDKKHKAEGKSKFDGSFDWHSDVHAHWALLSIARTTGDQALDEKLQATLDLKRLQSEVRFLSSSGYKNFEAPYGRAWFLMLLAELSRRPIGQDPHFQSLRRQMTIETGTWLQKNAFPELQGGKFIGTHTSWLMATFLAERASRDLPDLATKFTQLIAAKVDPAKERLAQAQTQQEDFIHLPSLSYLVLPEAVYEKPMVALPAPKSYVCHTPGTIQMSMWAHAEQCAKHDAKSCDLIQTRSQSFYARTDLWKDNFDCVSHWIPQFMWMTHWLSLGMP